MNKRSGDKFFAAYTADAVQHVLIYARKADHVIELEGEEVRALREILSALDEPEPDNGGGISE